MRRAARGACRQTRGAPIRLTTTLATVPSVVGVVGLGASGKAAARLALARGARQVRLFDSDADVDAARLARDVTPDGREACGSVHAGPHANHAEAIAACDVVVLSPGVPYARVPVLADAAAADVAVSELSFAARFLPSDMPVVMITGTNGKSTTTAFAAALHPTPFSREATSARRSASSRTRTVRNLLPPPSSARATSWSQTTWKST